MENNNAAVQFNVPINEEALKKAFTEAVLKSTIGKAIIETIEKNIKDLLGWNGIVQSIVKNIIHETVLEIINKDYKEQIRSEVRMYFTKDKTKEIIHNFFETTLKRY